VLIDDVLAVGDIAFQQKCVDRVHALKDGGATMVVAFSDDALVRALATRIVTLENGHVVSDVAPAHWMDTRPVTSAADIEWQVARDLPEDELMAMRAIEVAAYQEAGAGLDVTLGFDVKAAGVRCRPSVFVLRGKVVVFRSAYPEFVEVDRPSRLSWTVQIPTWTLSNGVYSIIANMQTLQAHNVYSMKAYDAVTFTLRHGAEPPDAGGPILSAALRWEVEPLVEPAVV
jgi:hypothetical protein